MNTSFTITCTGWEDPDGPLTYEFGYINYFQIYVFYVSPVSSAPSVKLPLGHEDNEFKLPMRIQIIDRLGAATIVLIDVKVRIYHHDHHPHHHRCGYYYYYYYYYCYYYLWRCF